MCSCYFKIQCLQCNHEILTKDDCHLTGGKIKKNTLEADRCYIRINPITRLLEKGCYYENKGKKK